jgi:serine/threonine protein kinase
MTNIAPGTRIRHYVVEAVLPGGGFAQVVVARRQDEGHDGGRVALKIARTDGPKTEKGDAYELALVNEVQRLQELRHPGIVTILPLASSRPNRLVYRERAQEIRGQPWFFGMEYLAGGPIEDLLSARRGLPPKLAAELAHQVCMALDYMHVRGYAHLDVKPKNILLREPLRSNRPPEAVLIDLGTTQKEGLSPDVSGASLHFLPPERIHIVKRGAPPETLSNLPAVDVYSLGISLYQMLTGQLPFSGSKRSVTTAILNDEPTIPSEYAASLKHLPGVDELLLAMLAKSPDDRPSIRQVAAELDRLFPLPRLRAAELPDIAPDRAMRRWKRAFAVVSLVAVAEVGLFAVGASALSPMLDVHVRGGEIVVQIRDDYLPTRTPPTALPPTDRPATSTPFATYTRSNGGVVVAATSTPTERPATPTATTRAPSRPTATTMPTRTPTRTPPPTAVPPTETPQP